ncbi:unnamed protein product, partial [Urochloa humidicola]
SPLGVYHHGRRRRPEAALPPSLLLPPLPAPPPRAGGGRSGAVAAAPSPRCGGFPHGMARRPGGDGYSPARSGGGGDRASKEMAPLFPGCDYEHWLIAMDKPGGEGATKQQMINFYIQTLVNAIGSEEEAKRKIYNVSSARLTRRRPTSSRGFPAFSLCCQIRMLP